MIEELHIHNGQIEIQIQVIRSNRKTLGLEIKENLEVYARIPLRTTDKHLKEFVQKNERWIFRKYQEVKDEAAKRPAHSRPLPTEAEKREILEKIAGRVYHYEKIMNLSANRITVKNQKTRWGSCSSKKNLNFNYKLAYMPQEILDYVVVHELAHLRHMNHSREFWALVEQYLPDYRQRRNWLKEHGKEY